MGNENRARYWYKRGGDRGQMHPKGDCEDCQKPMLGTFGTWWDRYSAEERAEFRAQGFVPHAARGKCHSCYYRWRKGRRLTSAYL